MLAQKLTRVRETGYSLSLLLLYVFAQANLSTCTLRATRRNYTSLHSYEFWRKQASNLPATAFFKGDVLRMAESAKLRTESRKSLDG